MSTNHRELVLLSVLAFCWALASRVDSGAAVPAGLVDQPQVARAASPAPRAVATSSGTLITPRSAHRPYTREDGTAEQMAPQGRAVVMNHLIVARR
jgi:hypothetical protein